MKVPQLLSFYSPSKFLAAHELHILTSLPITAQLAHFFLSVISSLSLLMTSALMTSLGWDSMMIMIDENQNE